MMLGLMLGSAVSAFQTTIPARVLNVARSGAASMGVENMSAAQHLPSQVAWVTPLRSWACQHLQRALGYWGKCVWTSSRAHEGAICVYAEDYRRG